MLGFFVFDYGLLATFNFNGIAQLQCYLLKQW
jgi:hypothetical protein